MNTFTENADQVALRKWIEAGLSIPEVRALKGDAGYLLNNMIAKYTLAADHYAISEQALAVLQADSVDLSLSYPRRHFYGKKGGRNPFIYEHAVPVTVVRSHLLSCDLEDLDVSGILQRAGEVALLLRTEDEKILQYGLGSKMPVGWQFGDDPLYRYKAVGIRLSSMVLRVTGTICR